MWSTPGVALRSRMVAPSWCHCCRVLALHVGLPMPGAAYLEAVSKRECLP